MILMLLRHDKEQRLYNLEPFTNESLATMGSNLYSQLSRALVIQRR